MTPVILIATYGRPDKFARLVAQLDAQPVKQRVFVAADGPEAAEYVRRLLPDFAVVGFESSERYGREGYWRLMTELFQCVREELPRFRDFDPRIVQLDDDFVLCNNFFERAEALYQQALTEGLRGVRLHTDGRSGCWNLGSGPWRGDGTRTTEWVDGGWYGGVELLERLSWKIDPVPPSRWAKQPLLGSGVWQQASRRWHQQGVKFIQSRQSLVLHADSNDSQMNPQHPRKGPSVQTQGWDDD